MSSRCFSFRILLAPQWRRKNLCFLIFLRSKSKISFIPSAVSSSTSDNSVPTPKQSQPLRNDPSNGQYEFAVTTPKPRDETSGVPKPQSWFGPNGQYIRELPCPTCRGRGYTPCTECGIERSRLDCSQCNGKSIMTCQQCLGNCVIWEESIDEQPWEKARSTSPLKVKEDDEVDNLELKMGKKKKAKRVYPSPSPEVGLKISRSLKSLNAKTGLFSKRMKIIHSDPTLEAQRVASIKKAKGTAAARRRASEALKAFFSDPENRHKRSIAMKVVRSTRRRASEALKAFFSDPENRHKRSIAMKGVRFYCRNCGREGHRRHYCPELRDSLIGRQFRCRLCGEKGHNRRTCQNSRSSKNGNTVTRNHRCRLCRQSGHNRRTCPQITGVVRLSDIHAKRRLHIGNRTRSCQLCGEKGHNIRTCPLRIINPLMINPQAEEGNR